MLDQDANISFIPEIMDAIDAFLVDYQTRQDVLRNDLERGLVVSYLLGIMHCEMQKIWDELGKSPAFGALHPRVVFEDCAAVDHDDLAMARRLDVIRREFTRRGWTMGAQR
jgi:hypothetical protein